MHGALALTKRTEMSKGEDRILTEENVSPIIVAATTVRGAYKSPEED